MHLSSIDLQQIGPESVVNVPVSSIKPSAFQIRTELGGMEDLKRSIIEKGLLHPIVVRVKNRSWYEVVAGNRRLEAFRSLGRSIIPCIITKLNDQDAFEVMITENIQRETLSPLEEARAFYSYVGPKEKNCYGYGKVSELAKRIGKSQEYVSNRMRLLRLPEKLLRQLFSHEHFTVSHAEQLVSLAGHLDSVEELSDLLLSEKISVRELERAVQMINSGIDAKRAVELSHIESDMKLEWNYNGVQEDRTLVLMKRTEMMLKSMLSYIDNAGIDLEYDESLHKQWIAQVRLKIHDAISGVISCRNERVRQRKNTTSQSLRTS